MRCKIVYLVVPFLLTTCHKSSDYQSVQIIGHAGSGLQSSASPYSSDSKEAIDYALSLDGIAGVEVDVQYSNEETAWLFHDLTLDDKTNGKGCINLKSDHELEGLHYSTIEKEELARLSEITVPSAKRIFFDVRSNDGCTGGLLDQSKAIAAIEKSLQNSTAEVLIVVTNPYWVEAFYQKGWKVYLNAYTAAAYTSDDNYVHTAGICIRNKDISFEEVLQIQQGGKEVLIFDVRSPKGIRSALKKLPDFLLTDDLRATLIEKNR